MFSKFIAKVAPLISSEPLMYLIYNWTHCPRWKTLKKTMTKKKQFRASSIKKAIDLRLGAAMEKKLHIKCGDGLVF